MTAENRLYERKISNGNGKRAGIVRLYDRSFSIVKGNVILDYNSDAPVIRGSSDDSWKKIEYMRYIVKQGSSSIKRLELHAWQHLVNTNYYYYKYGIIGANPWSDAKGRGVPLYMGYQGDFTANIKDAFDDYFCGIPEISDLVIETFGNSDNNEYFDNSLKQALGKTKVKFEKFGLNL